MADVSKAPFSWESKPKGVSWVDKLSADQAIAQCLKWNVTPENTLESNRVILKEFIKNTKAQAEMQTEEPVNKKSAQENVPKLDNLNQAEEFVVFSPISSDQTITPLPPALTVTSVTSPLAGVNSVPTFNPMATHNQAVHTEPDQPQWMAMVQATASAVGQSITNALSQSQIGHHNSGHVPIPRAFYDLVNALPHCSGADNQVLLNFLVGTNQIFELDLIDQKQAFLAILPKTSGQMRSLWFSTITHGLSYSNLKGNIISNFLPDRAKQQLISEVIYRIQRNNEPLIDFITNVKDAARILMPSQSDLLDIILTGINSPTRALLAGFPAPTTVDQLIELIPRIEVVRRLAEVDSCTEPLPAIPPKSALA